jgi:hypothetical protein
LKAARMTYAELCKQLGSDDIPYDLLLRLTKEWADRRETILFRDRHTCLNCHRGSAQLGRIPLIPHHLYYIEGRLPWDYANDVYVTLCQEYHDTYHKMEKYPVYKEQNGKILELAWVQCDKCREPGWYAKHGMCFDCNGWKSRREYRPVLNPPDLEQVRRAIRSSTEPPPPPPF